MPYDSEGNWITLEQSEQGRPAAVPSYLTDTSGSYNPEYSPDYSENPEDVANRDSLFRKLVPVLTFLHQFERPSNALWGGLYGGAYGSDREGAPPSFLTGLKRGALQQGAPINASEFFGIRPPTGDMPWWSHYDTETGEFTPGWLGQAGTKLAVDLAGDPLTYAFLPAKTAGLGGRAIKALFPFLKEGQSLGTAAIEATKIPKAVGNVWQDVGGNRFFGHNPATLEEQLAMDTAMRKNEQVTKEVRDLATANEKKATEIMRPEDWLADPAMAEELRPLKEQMTDVFHGVERPAEWPKDVPPEVADLIDPLLEKRDEVFRLLNQAREAAGYKPIANLSDADYTQMLHWFYGKGPQDTGEAVKGRIRGWFTGRPQSRELAAWRDAETGAEVVPGLISKEEFLPKYGFEPGEKPGEWLFQGRPVTKDTQTTIKDILEAKNLNFDPSMVQTNPFRNIVEQVRRQMGQKTFLDTVEELKGMGALRPVEKAAGEVAAEAAPKQGWWDYLKNITEDRPWRTPNVQGLDRFETHPQTADWLENMAKAPFLTNTPFGKLNEIMEKIRYTDAGQLHHDFLQSWKRSTLARPARWFMDEMSRLPQIYSEGNVAPWDIVPRHIDTWRTRLGSPKQVFEGIPNEVWKDIELPIRQMTGKESVSRYAGEEIGKSAGPGRVAKAMENVPGGSVPTAIAEGWGKYNAWMLDKVRIAEENHKIAAMFDYLKKNHPDLGRIYQTDPEAFGRIVDEAARFSKNTMGDYSRYGHTPSESLAMETMPFYRWWRYAVPTVAANAIQHPQRYARQGRFYDTVFDTSTPEEYKNMDDWQKEQAVIHGAFGKPFDEWAQNPLGEYSSYLPDWMRLPQREQERAFSVGRGMHTQHLNELLIAPIQSMLSKIDPVAKVGAEEALNRNFFMKDAIDRQVAADKHAYPFKQLIEPGSRAYSKTFGMYLPAGWEHLYGGLMPGGIQLKEFNMLARGLGHDLGIDFFEDPNKNTVGTLEALIAFITGRKVYGWDPERNERKREYEKFDERQAIVRDLREAEKKDNRELMDIYEQKLSDFDEAHGGPIKRPRKVQ